MEATTSHLRFAFLAVGALLLLLLIRSSLHLSSTDDQDLLDRTTNPKISVRRSSHHIAQPRSQTATAAAAGNPFPTKPDQLRRTPHHPLDPLTIDEINTARAALHSHPPFSSSPASVTVHSLVLEEPDKGVVMAWRLGDPLPQRVASVIARFRGRTHLLTVELEPARVASHAELDPEATTGYPTLTSEDMTSTTWAALSDPAFNRTVLARGVRLSDVTCLPISTGWFGATEERRRLIKVQCYSAEGTSNFYMRPIEGLTVLVDMDTLRVVSISDRGPDIPIPRAAGTDYVYPASDADRPRTATVNPISIEQPKGPSFTVQDGHVVRWAGWEFHLKPDPRAGVVLSRVAVTDPDTGERRSVMYKGMTSELFVPYMDPTEAWYFKTYLDAGEYGFGLQAMPLVPLNDCPRNAYYMDGVFAAADGRPYVRENMVCVFESYAGDIAWRHAESPITGMGVREVRPKVTLVVRMAASVGNYDYIVDWEFQMDGLIRVKVAFTSLSVFPCSYTVITTIVCANKKAAMCVHGRALLLA
ncbi:hypothetical protein Taro_056375 [Colocasia esculenta]|uniref:Amine oxidase n=1 Tax=Colocasia esculenta TaxID=4460 RepID=A0A843XWA8_COLES|nr:hypothetical protein [Colocasia esculenta]